MGEQITDEQRYVKVLEYFRAPFPICPRCANGFPVCAAFDKKLDPDSDASFRVLSCGCPTYTWSDDVCPACEKEMEADA